MTWTFGTICRDKSTWLFGTEFASKGGDKEKTDIPYFKYYNSWRSVKLVFFFYREKSIPAVIDGCIENVDGTRGRKEEQQQRDRGQRSFPNFMPNRTLLFQYQCKFIILFGH